MGPRIGDNINGPSLIAAPPWLDRPLGRYYLYFADHEGTFIRLAFADVLAEPWQVHPPGVLSLDESLFTEHVASPDVHVDVQRREVRMYFHGREPLYAADAGQTFKTDPGDHFTRVAVSQDGLRFRVLPDRLALPYLRAVRWNGWWYALGMPGVLYRSADGLKDFEEGPTLFPSTQRHTALRVRDDMLEVFHSDVGDCPERIRRSRVALHGDWMEWRAGEPEEVIAPELDYEGANEPLAPSVRGAADGPVNQLRDPALFEEQGRTYLLYSVAGERGIAIAELSESG